MGAKIYFKLSVPDFCPPQYLSGMSIADGCFLPVPDPDSVLFWKPAFIHDTQFPVDLAPVADWHGPFLGGLKRSQVQGFQ